jgi:hypothetical protein
LCILSTFTFFVFTFILGGTADITCHQKDADAFSKDCIRETGTFNVTFPSVSLVIDRFFVSISLNISKASALFFWKDADGKLRELQRPSGGAWGGTRVDEAFNQLLNKIVHQFLSQKTVIERLALSMLSFRLFLW